MNQPAKETPEVNSIAAFVAVAVASIEGVNNAALISAANDMVTGKNALVGCEKLTLPKSVNPEGKRIERNEFDAGFVDSLAHDYVTERYFGSMARDLHFGIDYGIDQIEATLKRIAGLRIALRRKSDPDMESDLVQRICWLTQQKCQQAYRKELFIIAAGLYKEATGLEWVAPPKESKTMDATTAAETILLTA